MLQAALPNGFRLRMLPRSVPAVFRQTGEIFYIGGTDVLPAPLEGQEEADAIAGLSDPENETARSELIEHNLRLVVYIAQKFDNTGVGVEDLISIGTIGLIKAINTFNPEKKIKLATYASRCIENEILMYLRRNNKTRMEVSIDEPLNVDWDGNELLLSDILGTEEDVIYQGLEQEAEHRVLGSAISKLSEREQVIVKLRFGINMPEGREKTQKEVADLLGISQSYISRLEKRIMKRLRKEIAPMFGLIIAFKNYKITGGKSFIYNLFHSDWAGFKNFSFLIRSNDLFVILRNTILYNLAFIALGMVFSVGLAIMISLLHNKRASKVYQTMMFFPYFMSWVVASYFLDAFLNQDNGLINSILRNAGKEPIQWYMSAGVWPFILIFMYLWKSTGYNMVIYLSSISGIDTTLYEAAVMDGANKRQQVWHITLPCLKSVIIMMFILNVGKVFYSDFGLFFQLSQGASGSIFKTTATIDTYVYNALQSSTPIGMTSAATFFQSVACCITILLANAIVKKIDEDSAII